MSEMVHCRACGQEMHITATACPKCGAVQLYAAPLGAAAEAAPSAPADATTGVAPGVSFGQSISICFSKYVTWAGRASRSEYWWFQLFTLLGCLALVFVAHWAYYLFALATFLPGLSVVVRRLHDTDRSGWWYWIGLIPLIGAIVLLVFLIQEGKPNTRFDAT